MMTMTKADQERLTDMAQLCVALRMTPTEYWELTLGERNALVEVLNEHSR
jgi:hypothetical protein